MVFESNATDFGWMIRVERGVIVDLQVWAQSQSGISRRMCTSRYACYMVKEERPGILIIFGQSGFKK